MSLSRTRAWPDFAPLEEADEENNPLGLDSIPEYTSYDQMLAAFKRIVPVPSVLKPEHGYHLSVDGVEQMIHDMGISALLLSNPHNPTGQVIHGEDLKRMVELSRKGTTMILDEFYEQYIYDLGEGAQVSAAEFVEDVESDNVVLIGGRPHQVLAVARLAGLLVSPSPFGRPPYS